MQAISQYIATAAQNLQTILSQVFCHAVEKKALVVFDAQCELAQVLTAGYRLALADYPLTQFVEFERHTPEQIHLLFAELNAADLVVLVQSTNFRLEAFRIRVELFKRGLKVLEHPHLARMVGAEINLYIDALAYDSNYYQSVGQGLKSIIDQAQGGVLDSGGDAFPHARLHIESAFESAKLNVGDYSAMSNVGGQFPIGEVFTEARILEAVNGRVRIHAFGDTQFRVNRPATPITLVVEKGQVVGTQDSTPEFDTVLANIRADEQVVWLREIGCGLNPALTAHPTRTVSDIGTYERMCGVHLSLGAKHGIYPKPGFKRNDGKHHVDVFAVTERLTMDHKVLFQNGAWQI